MNRRRQIGPTLLVTAMLASACGSTTRSAEAFCDVMVAEQTRIRQQFDQAVEATETADDEFVRVIGGLGASLQAMGELRTYFRKLAAVAPEAIRTEAELVAEWYDDEVESAGEVVNNPLGAVVDSVVGGVMISGQLDTLGRFARQECGRSI